MSEVEGLRSLIAQRAKVKAQLARFKTFLEGCSSDNVSLVQLRIRLQKTESLWAEFDRVQTEIEEHDQEDASREAFENEYYRLVAEATIRLEARDREEKCSTPSPSSATSLVKLPTIALPTFSGKYEEWLNFYDTFRTIIHEKDELLPVHKFQYLKSSLIGEAHKLVESLCSSEENYQVAWNLLISRYQNKRIIAQIHVQNIINAPAITRRTELRELLNTVNRHINALEAMGLKQSDFSDLFLMQLIVMKLDPRTKEDYRQTFYGPELIPLGKFLEFLNNKCQAAEETTLFSTTSSGKPVPTPHKLQPPSRSFAAFSNPSCSLCRRKHPLYQCDEFLRLNVRDRRDRITALKLCYNCFRNHSVRECRSSNCKTCGRKHHTLLHPPEETAESPAVTSLTSISPISQVTLLSTAILFISGRNSSFKRCRVLLDSGSQCNFISSRLAHSLKLTLVRFELPVSGVNNVSTHIKYKTSAHIKSTINSYQRELDFLVIDKITDRVPSQPISLDRIQVPASLQLADPTFYQPGEIDLLIGAGLFYEMLCIGQIRLGRNLPILQKTQFGWIVAGPTPIQGQHQPHCHLTTLHENISRFWQIETYDEDRGVSINDQTCENHFKANTKRLPNGRFQVRLPFVTTSTQLGNSFKQARQRFYALEERLERNQVLKQQYHDFIQEYIALGHMRQTSATISPRYFLPHHDVLKSDHATTKLRVVFDGSAKTDLGNSLNDMLMVGPIIQQDLFCILLRFRIVKYAMAADIEKMYRQVLIHPDDEPYQTILWQFNVNESIEQYTLRTVTYGTASAPFLAIRSLFQLAEENKDRYPEAAESIMSNFYGDDWLSGANSIDAALRLKKQVSAILKNGGFPLRKWVSNNTELTEGDSNVNSASGSNAGSASNTGTGTCCKSFSSSLVNSSTSCNGTADVLLNGVPSRMPMQRAMYLMQPNGPGPPNGASSTPAPQSPSKEQHMGKSSSSVASNTAATMPSSIATAGGLSLCTLGQNTSSNFATTNAANNNVIADNSCSVANNAGLSSPNNSNSALGSSNTNHQ